MSVRSLEHTVVVALAGALVLLGMSGAVSWWTIVRLRQSAAEDRLAEEALTRQQAVLAAVNAAVAAQRGYTITGDVAHLAPYSGAKDRARSDVVGLQRLIEDQSDGQRTGERLARLIEERFSISDMVIDTYHTAGRDAALAATARGEGLRLHNEIRALIADMERRSSAQLAASEADTERALRAALAAAAGEGIMALLFLGSAFHLIRRDIAGRRSALRAMQESEERFHCLVDSDSQVVWTTDARGLVTEAPAWCAYTGQTPDDARGTGWLGALHPDDRARAQTDWTQAVGRGQTLVGEWRVRRRDGWFRHLAVRAVPVLNADGTVREWVCAGQDATQRKRMEARLRQLSRLYIVLSQTNQLIVRQPDREAVLDGACRILVEHGGLPFACVSIESSGGLAAVASATGADAPAALAADLSRAVDRSAAAARVLADGQRRAWSAVGPPALGDAGLAQTALQHGLGSSAILPLTVSGRPQGTLTLFAEDPRFFDADELRLLDELAMDVSLALTNCAREQERQRVLEELRTSQERFRELAGTIEEVFWVTDSDKRRMLYVSPGYERIWGRSCESLYETPTAWMDAVHVDDRERVRLAAMTRQSEGLFNEEYRIVRPDGAVRWISDQAFPVRDESGHVHRVVGVARDITDQRLLQDQLRQSQKLEAVGRLAGGVAHDFNNLLTVVLGYGDLVRDTLPPSARAGCDEIMKAADRAKALTRQLLAFSRRQALAPETVDVREVLVDIEKMLRRLIGEDIELIVAPASDLGLTWIDRGQLEQVVVNLAVNARDAMPSGGTLTLRADNEDIAPGHPSRDPVPPGHYIALRVTDTGIGMDEATKARAFDPFFTTKPQGEGTGLGLATVYGIVRQSNGAIVVDSSPGEGSTFTVYLPRTTRPRVTSTSAASTLVPVRPGARVLVVEDEMSVRVVIAGVLASRGYEIREAGSAEEALEMMVATESRPDLLLTDVVLPGLSGPELAERLLVQCPRLKVLFMSGYIPERREFSALNTQDLLLKPFPAETLLHKVHERLVRSLEADADAGNMPPLES